MIKANDDYDNSHFTDEYHPMYCFNCHSVFGWRGCRPESIEVSWRPGINAPILFVKYVKTEKFWYEVNKVSSTTDGDSG